MCGNYCGSYSDYPTVRFYNLISSGTGYYFYCSDKTCGYSDYEFCQYGCSNGICNPQPCTSHSTYSCYSNDVYWYDSCGDIEEKKEDCEGRGCSNGQCNPEIICSYHSDCGTNSYTGEEFCQNDDSYKNYITYTCNNPGTYSSSCSQITLPKLVEDCGTNEYGPDYCYNDDVYRDFTEKGCSSSLGFCYSYTTSQEVQDCSNGCTENRCKVKVCETVCSYGGCKEYCIWQ